MEFRINGTVIFRHKRYSTGMLKNAQKNMVDILRKHQWNRKRPVALVMERTPRMLAMIFALLQEHIAFLPLDVSMPEERLQYMLDKADVSCVLSDVLEKKSYLGREIIRITDEPKKTDCVEKSKTTKRSLVTYAAGIEDTAYLLFTSGTTGYPKAVEISHRSLANFVQALPKRIDFLNGERMGCFTGITFDIFFLESIMALCMGMTVVLADDAGRNNPKFICDLILNERITALQMTPSMLRMLQMVDGSFSCLSGVRVLMVGGEVFPIGLLRVLQKAVKEGSIYNMYGPTEATIWSSIANLSNTDIVHVGTPIDNTEIYIVDDSLQLLNAGEEGEIAIAGEGLAKGYCNDEEKTAKSFVYLMVDGVQRRVYLTGDLGYMDDAGNIFCSGRKDTQVKILGHRIELADIEENIRKISGVTNAVVAVYGEEIKRLACFYTADMELAESFLAAETKLRVPAYMLPSKWVRVPAICYTTSRKTDRNAMIERYLTEQKQEEEYLFEQDEKGRTTKIIDFLLKKGKKISPDMEIKEIMADSIQYIEFMVYMEECFDIELEDEMLSRDYFKTLGDLIRSMNQI